VLLIVEPQQLLARRQPRRSERYALVQALRQRFLLERSLAVDRKRVTVGKTVVAQGFADKEQYFRFHGLFCSLQRLRAAPAILRFAGLEIPDQRDP